MRWPRQCLICYDWADRLLSSTVTGAVSDATSVADGVGASERGASVFQVGCHGRTRRDW